MKTRFEYRHQYDDERDEAERYMTDIECQDPSLTQQQFTEDADLNVIAKRFGINDGSILPQATDPRHFGDFTETFDLRTALDRTNEAIEKFRRLPAKLRERFNNNPGKLYDWVSDPDNAEEAVHLGLLAKAPKPETPPPILVRLEPSPEGDNKTP